MNALRKQTTVNTLAPIVKVDMTVVVTMDTNLMANMTALTLTNVKGNWTTVCKAVSTQKALTIALVTLGTTCYLMATIVKTLMSVLHTIHANLTAPTSLDHTSVLVLRGMNFKLEQRQYAKASAVSDACIEM